MKKGLLLSLVASTMIFAGGDIAPVEPVADAPASDCKEFWGSVGVYYRTVGGEAVISVGGVPAVGASVDLFDFNQASVTAVLGYEGALGTTDLKFGIEVAGWTSLGLDSEPDWSARVAYGADGGELSQIYAAYTFNNTAIKGGRLALPQVLSPWAWSDRNQGILDDTFEGVVVANTDAENTTIYGAYVHSIVFQDTRRYVGNLGGRLFGVTATADDDNLGLFALGFVNTSLADTTITGVGYYVPEAVIVTAADGLGALLPVGDYAAWALFGSVTTKVGGMKLEVNGGYVDADEAVKSALVASHHAFNTDATWATSARISGKFGAVDASLAASYINDGVLPIVVSNGTETSMLYTANAVDGQIGTQLETYGVLAKASTKLGMGTLWGTLGYWDGDNALIDANKLGARIGYKFDIAGMNVNVQYRYTDTEISMLPPLPALTIDAQIDDVRVDVEYKF